MERIEPYKREVPEQIIGSEGNVINPGKTTTPGQIIQPAAAVTSEAAAQGTANKANPTITGSSIPGVRVYNNAPAMIGNYAFDTDFQSMINDASARGDYGAAAMYERLRNQKLGYMDSPYRATYQFNYADPYRGQLDRMQEDIMNRGAFSYDYRDDEQYKALKSLKEKEAQKAYDDGYAALSNQFEGDIPVNMINKLLDTKSDIIDQADSYIPQLRQMAYEMYMNEGDQMMRNYSMMQDAANQDYNRWAADRDLTISSAENAYNRAWNQKMLDNENAWNQKMLDNENAWKQAAYDQWMQEFYESRAHYNDSQDWQQKSYDLDKAYYDLEKYRTYNLGK